MTNNFVFINFQRSMFMARNEPESGKWRTRDIVAMATRYRSDPIYLEACYGMIPECMIIQRINHYAYV